MVSFLLAMLLSHKGAFLSLLDIPLAIWFTVFACRFIFHVIIFPSCYLWWNVVALPPACVSCSFHDFKLKNEMGEKKIIQNIENKLCVWPQRGCWNDLQYVWDVQWEYSEKAISTYLGHLWNRVKHDIVTFKIDPRDDFFVQASWINEQYVAEANFV